MSSQRKGYRGKLVSEGIIGDLHEMSVALEEQGGKGKITQTSLGKIGVCEKCGKTFEQGWLPKQGEYTQFKKCRSCLAKFSGVKPVYKIEIPYVPHPGQQLVHDSKARFRLIAAGSRWGKDRCCIMEFIKLFTDMLSEDRGPDLVPAVLAWFVAPTYMYARQLWREFKCYFPREWIVNAWENDKIIETVNDGFIEIRSADDPNSLVGVGLDIVVITEAGRITKLEEVWANLETRLMSPGRGPGGRGGVALINGTPNGRNFYYRMHRWGQKGDPFYDPDWESWNFPSWDNPYLTSKDKEYLQRLKKRYPQRIYDQEIMAKFLAEGNSVFPKADACASYIGDEKPVPGETYVIGYDPAKEVDFSGVIIRDSLGQTVYIRQWTGVPWTAQIEKITMLSRQYNHATVVIDKTGLGETLPSMLRANGVLVDEVHFTNIMKEQLVNHLAMLIEQEAISYPNYEPLINELKDYQYYYTKTGKISFSASGSEKHDDLVTALMLAYKNYNIPEVTLPYMGVLEGVKKRTA